MERLDDLLIDNMKIYQDTEQFCFSIDAIILAHFVKVNPRWKYVDFGTGTGVIPLLLSARGATNITGIEINPAMATLATRSVAYNHKEGIIHILEGDYRTMKWESPFDGILVNPPYRSLGTGKLSVSSDKALALHEVDTTLQEVIESARKQLKFGGYFWMIHLAERITDILSALRTAKLEPKRLRFVHSDSNKPAKFVLVEAKLGGNPPLKVDSPLCIYDENGEYTEEVNRWYGR